MNQEAPVYLQRAELIPASALQLTRDDAGLERTVTVFGEPAWLVSRAEDARTVLGDPGTFTSSDSMPRPKDGDGDRDGDDGPSSLLFMDPPEHTRLRRMLSPAFTGQSIRRLEPRIRLIVDDQLDRLSAVGSPADLVAEFSWEIPSRVICELLAIPPEDRASFRSLIDRGFDFSLTGEDRALANGALAEYIAALADRASAAPGDDVLGMLVREHGSTLSRRDLVGVGVTLLQAGHETTTDTIASAVLALLAHPDQLALLRNEPSWTGSAIEELLRYLSVVQIIPPRRASRDTVVGGQRVSAGDLLVVSLPAANHDPSLVDEPGRLDVTRAAPSHLAFGHGVHHCLGAPLARIEMAVALPALFRRFPGLALAVEPDKISYKANTTVHGVKALPVTWT